MTLTIGIPAPDFKLPDANGNQLSLTDFRGKWVVLYFYPKNNTPGCTLEATEFSQRRHDFETLGAVIMGVSPDSCKSHQNFIRKQDLQIPLLSDESHGLLEAYGVWQEKSMYGRSYMGVVRSTFLINPKGNIEAIWDKVSVKGHVDQVLEKLRISAGTAS